MAKPENLLVGSKDKPFIIPNFTREFTDEQLEDLLSSSDMPTGNVVYIRDHNDKLKLYTKTDGNWDKGKYV